MSTKSQRRASAIVYDVFLWLFVVIADLFFREIHPRSTWRIPKKGPVIFVAAPHANQFVDPLLLMRVVRQDARRRIAFLIAAKSMDRAFIGFAARLVGSVPVGRAMDMKKPVGGRIYLPDPNGDPTLIRGVDVDFKSEKFMEGGLLVLPSVDNASANAEIAEIISSEEIRLKKPFKGDVALKQLTGKQVSEGTEGSDDGSTGTDGSSRDGSAQGTRFSVAPHVDQSKVYEAVFRRIREGGCIGIFPEGGSHDRTELLPLKAGLAIMALGALAEDPDCGVTIVPVGMNYFHAHKFRSRAVIEFGAPITVDPELVEQYRTGHRRDAISKVLTLVHEGLAAVTVQAQDYDTLMLIQAVRRLYNPKGKKLPLPFIIELNRRLIKGYETFKDDPRIMALRKSVLDYNRTLFRLNIRDHQVSYAKFSWAKVIFLILQRLGKLALLSLAVAPGLILFSPVFILGKLISRQKAKEALAASSVKIKARDVIATWKILVSLALAPALDIFYTTFLVTWTYTNRVQGLIPRWIPLSVVAIAAVIAFPAACFGALRFGEIGMDIVKSLRPLLLSANPSQRNTFVRLRHQREWLQQEVNEIINELGPSLFPDFDQQRIIDNPNHPLHSPERSRPTTPTSKRDSAEVEGFSFTPVNPPPSTASHTLSLPHNDSFKDLSKVGFFASNPSTPYFQRSRTGSQSHPSDSDRLGMTSLEPPSSSTKPGSSSSAQKPDASSGFASGSQKADLNEVSRNLHEAMRERGRRRLEGADGEDWEFEPETSGRESRKEL